MDALKRWAPIVDAATPPDAELARWWQAARAAQTALEAAGEPEEGGPEALAVLEALRALAERAARVTLTGPAPGEDARTLEGEVRIELGRRLASLQRPRDARVELEIALALLPSGAASESACAAFATLSMVCEAEGDHRAALEALRTFVVLRDAIQEAEVSARVARLEARLSAERATLTRHDALTGLYNRRHVGELVAREIGRARRIWRPLTLILMQLDAPAAARAPEAVDALLRGVALRLPTGLRDHDIAARWDADVFCVVLPDTDAAGAEVPAHRLVERVRARPVDTPAGAVSVTASVGVTSLESGDTALDELILRAERALERARAEGGDRAVAWPFSVA